jgi:hypothetical protein
MDTASNAKPSGVRIIGLLMILLLRLTIYERFADPDRGRSTARFRSYH